MTTRWLTLILTIPIVLFCVFFGSNSLNAQNNNSDEIEVYLDFRHRGIISSVVISYYKNDKFYLPVSELFSLFSIDHTVNGLVIDGRFGIEQTPYRINFNKNQITFGKETVTLAAEDYILKELDSYIRADIFREAFGLNFSIDFNNLTLNLQTNRELPSVQEAIRKQKRRIAEGNRYQETKYELKYGRERPFLDGGFVDYNLSASLNNGQQIYNINTNLGLQVYGGDLQGAVFGNYSDNYQNVSTNNLRWRYMYRDKPWLTKLTIGQTVTDGFTRSAYTGVRISNEPIEPRRLFDEFVIQGNTIPQSEVELYMNNSLLDFQEADDAGNYRFLSPISYGTSQLNLRIYGPTGQVIEQSKRIQIPFTFQPEGVFNYNINAGQLDNPIFGETDQDFVAQGNGAYGITNWLTARAGVEYFQGYHNQLPSFTSSLSTRILSNYILSLEAASNAYYRGMLNIVYANAASISVDYTNFTSGFGIYNPSNEDKRIVASVFYPFNFWGLPLNLRLSTFSRMRATSTNTTTFRVDANSRIGRLNLRVGYSDRQAGEIDIFNPGTTSYLETSATYNISANRNIPAYLRGVFLRSQLKYRPTLNRFESIEAVISQQILEQGRFQLTIGRNFVGNYNSIRFSIVIGLDKVRSNTTYNNIRGNNNFTQNIRGSIGYDTNYNNFVLTSRDQVGRSGAAIQLFVDNNNNGSFDEGDDRIKGGAVRIQRSGASSIQKNGILYYTQMQPYFYYNMEMNKSAIDNPMLVPELDKFGLITDPNRFKKVEIPFYMSGVMEGIVERELANGKKNGVGGLKILLSQVNGEFNKEIRTFSDGSFYDYELPPGQYELEIDPSQLEILNRKSIPEKIEFEVETKAEGDFVEGLSFLLVPQEYQQEEPVTSNIGVSNMAKNGGGISLEYSIAVDSLRANECRYGVQLGAFSTVAAAKKVVQNYRLESSSHIVYNEPRKLYAVRTGLFNGLGDASNFTRKVAENYPGAAVLNQCYGTVASDYNPGDIRFDLQFAAFTNPNRAEAFINTLKSKFELEAFQYQDPQSLLYKVRLGPFPTLKQAESRKSEILKSTSISEIYISKQELPASMIDVDFEFILQLGEFETPRKAALYAIRIEENFDFTSKILIDENKQIILVAEQVYKDWELIKKMRNMISDDPAFEAPVIHLMEIKNNKGFGHYWNIGDQTKEAMGGSK